MRSFLHLACLGLLTLAACSTPPSNDGFRPLFNGKNLEGWVPSNVAPNTFTARDGMIITTGIPTGTMRTDRMYENFIIEMEWRHMKPGGNSGLFLWGDPITSPGVPFARGIEVQVLDNAYGEGNPAKNVSFTTHGDVFPIHGATMTPQGRIAKGGHRSFPTEERSKSSPEWNFYHVVATNGTVRLSVNGKEVTVGTDCVPRKGYICLEAEGSECHFRNIRIKELPSTGATPEQTAKQAIGFKSLYTGIDLNGWHTTAAHAQHWQPKDWTLNSDGKGTGGSEVLTSNTRVQNFEMFLDYRLTTAKTAQPTDIAVMIGSTALPLPTEATGTRKSRDQWARVFITVKGGLATVKMGEQVLQENVKIPSGANTLALRHTGDAAQFASIYIRGWRQHTFSSQ